MSFQGQLALRFQDRIKYPAGGWRDAVEELTHLRGRGRVFKLHEGRYYTLQAESGSTVANWVTNALKLLGASLVVPAVVLLTLRAWERRKLALIPKDIELQPIERKVKEVVQVQTIVRSPIAIDLVKEYEPMVPSSLSGMPLGPSMSEEEVDCYLNERGLPFFLMDREPSVEKLNEIRMNRITRSLIAGTGNWYGAENILFSGVKYQQLAEVAREHLIEFSYGEPLPREVRKRLMGCIKVIQDKADGKDRKEGPLSRQIKALWRNEFNRSRDYEKGDKSCLLARLPKSPITVGLPNISPSGQFGNTCWLNSSIKFIAHTSFFDSMLTDRSSPQLKLQQLLRRVIVNLRYNRKVDSALYHQLLKEIQATVPGFAQIGGQEDASEFIFRLTEVLGWNGVMNDSSGLLADLRNKSGNYPRLGLEYVAGKETAIEGAIKYGKLDNAQPWIELTVPSDVLSYPECKMDLEKLLEAPDHRNVKPDLGGQGADLDYIVKGRLTTAPKVMMVYLKRGIITQEALEQAVKFNVHPDQYAEQLPNPIGLGKDGTVAFTRYEVECDKDGNILQFKPVETCIYEVKVAVTKSGGATSGHWVCDVKSDQGVMRHSDLQVGRVEGQLGRYGTLLQLELKELRPI